MTSENGADIDGSELVEQWFPYDGPHSMETVKESAAAISRLVRYLANATQASNAAQTLRYANATNRVISHSSSALFLFGQVFAQLKYDMIHKEIDSTLYDDRRDRPGAQTAAELADVLQAAQKSVLDAAALLNQAAELASHLGNEEPS